MLLIANNLTTRNSEVYQAFKKSRAARWNAEQLGADMLRNLAANCVAASADMLEINVQQHYDQPEAMEFAVRVVQQVTDLPLCLSTNNAGALKAGLKVCKLLPFANYISIDEARLREMLPLIASYGAGAVLLVSDPVTPTDATEMLKKAAILTGAANESGIPNDKILVDPGIIHVTKDVGQRHLAEVMEFLRALPDATEPAVRSTCWLENASVGAPDQLRRVIETALLPMLAGLGLSSVFMDVLNRENMRTVRLMKVFNNEVVYSDSEIE